MQDTACLGLVHGDDPQRCYGEGGGRGVHVLGTHVRIKDFKIKKKFLDKKNNKNLCLTLAPLCPAFMCWDVNWFHQIDRGTSLAAQWLGHHLLTWRVWIPSLVRELRSKPHATWPKN